MKRMVGAIILAMGLVALMVPTMASAVVTSHGIGATGSRFDSGRFVQINLTANCTLGEVLVVRATVTQDDAFGEASGGIFCTGAAQALPASLRTAGGNFDAGASTVCVIVATVTTVKVTEAEQSCATVTLT